jgi:preprotein translocase subunit YajC
VNGLGFLLVIVALAFLWLALIRPQKRRQQAQAAVWEGLQEGDEVVTAGGIYGEVRGFDGDDVVVRIAPEVEVRVARRAIAAITGPAGAEESPEEGESYSGDLREQP